MTWQQEGKRGVECGNVGVGIWGGGGELDGDGERGFNAALFVTRPCTCTSMIYRNVWTWNISISCVNLHWQAP